MKRRLLSAFLAVMMVLTMAPVAFAAEGDAGSSTAVAKIGDAGYATLAAAVAAAKNGDTVTLVKDTDQGFTVPAGLSITFDVNGKTLERTGQDIQNNGTLTIRDNTKQGKIIANGGNVGIAIGVGNNSVTTIEYANVEAVEGAVITGQATGATITIEDGVFSTSDNAVIAGNGTKREGNANVITINGGTFTGNIKSAGYIACGIYAPWKDIITVNGGNFTVHNGIGIVARAGQVTVNGGTFTCTGSAKGGVGDKKFDMDAAQCVYFDASNPAYPAYNSATDYIKLQGGTFSSDVSAYVAEGYVQNNGTVEQLGETNAVAKVGNTYYKTLAEAVSAADKNTVTLLKNTAEDVVIPADKTVTLDLNGKKLTNVQSDTITVTKGAKLTIAGKGTVDNVTNGKAAVYNNGTTTLNGGKYTRSAEADNTTSSSGGNSYYNILNHGAMTINEGVEVYSSGHFSSLVANGYYDYSATQKGDRTAYIESVGQAAPALTINNGTFSGGINTIKNDDNATLTINSGEFSNVTQAVVQNNNIATVNGGTFDADGYHALENWKYNSNYNAGNLTVTNGKFAGSIATNAAVKISGGLYTENPSKYLAASVKDGYKYAAVKHVSPYLFEVKEILNENVEVIPNVGAAKAKSAEGVVDKDDVAKVDAAAKVVAAPKISEAAAVVADKVDAKQYTEKATNITTADRIEVRAYLEVTPKEYSADSYKLNITPKYDIVVVGTDNQEQKFTGDTLLVSNETPVSVQLPDGFVTNTNGLYVQHKGHEYNADVSVNTVKVNGVDKNIYTAKFNNPDGFSDFTITKTTQSVAVIGNNKYTTLQNAIDAAQTGATIVLQKNCTEKVTVAGKSLTINRNSKTFDEANVTVGSNCTKEVKNDTIVVTYTKPSSGSSSGGSSSGKTTYKVTTSAVNNGGVNASPSNAEKGAAITITLSPDKGYKLDKLTVTDGSGKTVSTVKKSDTVYTFTMPASAVKVGVSYVKATETPSETKFNDVSANDWFASAVDYVTGKGMMNGTADNTFSPKANTTRGMVVTVLYRLENQPSTSAASFTDVASGAYYANAVAWANANGIVSGYGSGKFGPNDKVTREQLAAILYRYAQYKKYDVSVGEDTNILSYDDAQSISSYAIPAIQWACGAGVVTGKSGSKLDPKGNATRAEVAAMLMRFCENVK